MRKDRLYYSANLVGLTVLLYVMLATLLRSGLSLLLSVNLPGAELTNPLGMAEWLIQLLNCICTFVNLALPLWFLTKALRPLGVELPFAPAPRRATLVALPIFLMFTTLCTALASGIRLLLHRGGYNPPLPSSLPTGGVSVLLCLVATCVLPAFGEELLFRGAIQTLLRPWGDWFAILITSLFFSLLHHDLSQLPSIFAMSVFLGYLAVVTGSVLPGILLHFANNLSSFLLLWARQQMDATNLLGLSMILFTIYFACGIFALIALRGSGLLRRLPRYPTMKNRMGRLERLLYAPVCSFTLLLLLLTAAMEYFR